MKEINKIKYINSWNINLSNCTKYLLYLYYNKKRLEHYKKSINYPERLYIFHNILYQIFEIHIEGMRKNIVQFDDTSNEHIQKITGIYRIKTELLYLIDKLLNKIK